MTIIPQRLPVSLTPLEAVRAALLAPLELVAPLELPLSEVLGCIAADTPPLKASPPCDIAIADGWALSARDLVGASSYSPLQFAAPPVWVEAGDRLPDGCDCVIDADLVSEVGPMVQVLAEAVPGQGVRRAGGDIAAGGFVVASGRSVRALDLLLARKAGMERLKVRRPRLSVINIPAGPGKAVTARLIVEIARAAGANVTCTETAARDAASVARAIDAGSCDLVLTVGGTGAGRTDATIAALAQRGELIAHGIALQPGRTAAAARIENTPVLALPGAPDQALAVWWTLGLAMLDQLSGRQERKPVTLPLARKVASSVGIAEIVLLETEGDAWMPSAVGELSLQSIARADAWLAVPGGSEGYAADAPVDAYMMRD